MQTQQKERPLGPIYENPQQNGAQKRVKHMAPPPPKVKSPLSSSSSSSSFGPKSSESVSPASTPTSSISTTGAIPKKKPAPRRPPSSDGNGMETMDNRNVTLKRLQNAPLGFSIRGGREHGTGVFISGVDTNSEAHNAGVKAGDQILKINGFPVDQFVHEEVCMMLKQNAVVSLKLAGTGMLPVKDKGDVVLKPVNEVSDVKEAPPILMQMIIPAVMLKDEHKKSTAPQPPIPPAPPAPPHNTMRPIPPPMPTHMFVSELHSVAQQLRKLQITKDIALENPLLKQVAINQQQHDRLMSEFKEAHRKMFGEGGRFPDDFSDTEKTMERQKAERTEVLCVKNAPSEKSISPINLRSTSSSSSLQSIKTDSGRGSCSSSTSASSSPTASIVNVRQDNGGPELKPVPIKQNEPKPVTKNFGVQLKSNLRRESSNMELKSLGNVDDKLPLRREQSSVELGSGGGHVILHRENSKQPNKTVNIRRDGVPAERAADGTNVVCMKNMENRREQRSNSGGGLVHSSPFGTVTKKESSVLEKQFIIQDKNIKRENPNYIIPKKDFEKPEFKRDFSNLDIRQMTQGFEPIPEDHFVHNRSGRTEVIFIRNSRENGRDIETSSVISSDEGSVYSGSSGCGELVGRLRRQFEDPGSDSDASSGKVSVFSKKSLPIANSTGKITVSINMAPLPKNAC